MGLSMHDRRVLADIERNLAEHDPRLAQLLTSFGGGGIAPRGEREKGAERVAVDQERDHGHGLDPAHKRGAAYATALTLGLAALLFIAAIAVRGAALLVVAVLLVLASGLPRLIVRGRARRRERRAGR